MWWTAVFEPAWTVSVSPGNATPWELAVEAVDADLVARDPVGLIAAARADASVPLAWLPYLAAERSVNEFDGKWPEVRQRAVVRSSFALHQRLGVRAAMDQALAPLGYDVRVVEWFEVSPRRQPYTFRLRVRIADDQPWDAVERKLLVRTANGAKNLRSKLEAISLVRRPPANGVYVGGITRRQRTLRVGQIARPQIMRVTNITFLGAMSRRRRTVRVLPRP